MSGRNERFQLESLELSKSRRSERLKRKWEPQPIPGTKAKVHRRKRYFQFVGYPKLCSHVNGEFETLLERTSLRKYYSCLDWDCPSDEHVKDFFLHSKIVKKMNSSQCEIHYYPLQCQFPLVITMENLAGAFHLSLDGICDSWDTAEINDVKTETRFKLDPTQRYFSVGSAQTESLYILAKFASQALFIRQNSTVLSLHHMKFFRDALNGKPVAWGEILWRNLVKRIFSFSQLASKHRNNTDLTQKLTNFSYAAVVVAVLLRVHHGSEHDAWFENLRSSQAEAPRNYSRSDESDRELLIDIITKNTRMKAQVDKHETNTEDPLRFALCDSTIGAEEVHEQMGTDTEALGQAEGDGFNKEVPEDMRQLSMQTRNVQITTTNVVDMSDKEDEEVSIGEYETDDRSSDKTLRQLLDGADDCHMQEIVNKLIDLLPGSELVPENLNKSYEDGQMVRHEPEVQLIKHTPVTARPTRESPMRLVTETAQVPASTLVKMVHVFKHFLDGLDKAGVSPEVYLKLKARKFMDALRFELENRDLQEFSEETDFFGLNWSMDKIFDAQWTLQDRLRQSQKMCLKLKEEVNEIFTWFSLNKQFVSLHPKNSIPEKSLGQNQDAEDDRTVPLSDDLKILKEKMADVKDNIKIMEMVKQRQRSQWLKQRIVLVNRCNDMKFQYSKQFLEIKSLKGKLKMQDDIVNQYEETLQKESILRSCCEVTISNLRDEIQHLKGALTEKTEELQHALKERDKGIETAKLFQENFANSVEELERKDIEFIDAMTQINELKQTVDTVSDQLKAQNRILSDKNDEVSSLQADIAKWIADHSSCNRQIEILSREKRRVELQRMNQACITQEMEEKTKELQEKVNICKDRITESDQLLELKDQEIQLLKVRADTGEKKFQQCKKTRDLALDIMQRQNSIQDNCKRQVASLKEQCEKLEGHLDRVFKRESKLLKELEEEKERLEEKMLDQEQQDLWSTKDITESQNQITADMIDQLAKLRAETKDTFALTSRRLSKIIDRYKIVTRSYRDRSSASAG